MQAFTIGDTVRITGKVMKGVVGTVTHLDMERERYLVLITHVTQNWYAEDELELYRS